LPACHGRAQEREPARDEAIMQDMIYEAADKEEGDYTEYDVTQYDDVHEGYSIDEQPLFGNGGYTQGMGDGVTQDMAEEVTQATAATLATSLAATLADGKNISKRTASYNLKRTRCYATLGLRFPKIYFAVPSKGAMLIGTMWATTSMSIAWCVKKPSIAQTQRCLPLKEVELHPCRV
jgi:hypothetical protein